MQERKILKVKDVSLGIVLLLALGLQACNKSSNSPQGPSQNPQLNAQQVQDEVVSKLSVVSNNLPKQGDYREQNYLHFYDIENETCVYRINERTTVSQVNPTIIEQLYDRTSVAESDNSSRCPSQSPKMDLHELRKWGIEQYRQMRIDVIKEDLDPALYLKNDWVQSAKLISSSEIKYRGLKTQLVEMELVSKKGIKSTLKQYISLESIFLGRYEYIRTRNDNGFIGNYLSLVNYSVTGVSKN